MVRTQETLNDTSWNNFLSLQSQHPSNYQGQSQQTSRKQIMLQQSRFSYQYVEFRRHVVCLQNVPFTWRTNQALYNAWSNYEFSVYDPRRYALLK